jgi:hypothetical protein
MNERLLEEGKSIDIPKEVFYEAVIYPPKAEQSQYRYGIYNEPVLEIPPIPKATIFTIEKLEEILRIMKFMEAQKG